MNDSLYSQTAACIKRSLLAMASVTWVILSYAIAWLTAGLAGIILWALIRGRKGGKTHG